MAQINIDDFAKDAAEEKNVDNTINNSKVESWLTGEDEDRKLQVNFDEGSSRDADTEGRIFNMQVRTGLPPELIGRNLDRLELETNESTFDAKSFRQQSPIVAKWLSDDPARSAIAQDDLGNLSMMEAGLNFANEEYKQRTSFGERVFDRVKEGYLNLSSTMHVLSNMPQIERGAEAGSTGDFVMAYDPMGNPIYSSQLFGSEEQKALLVKDAIEGGAVASERMMESLLPIQAELAAIEKRPSTEAMLRADTVGEMLSAFATDPLGIIADIGITSATQQLPAIALTVATRSPAMAIAAAGGNSYALELGSGILDYLGKEGIDINDPQAVVEALRDDVVVQRAIAYGQTRGLIVGSLDALSGGVAAKSLIPTQLITGQTAREATNTFLAQPLVQGAMGATGEAGAQLATEGELGAPGEIFAEAIGEFSQAPIEAGAFALDRIRKPPQIVQDAARAKQANNAANVMNSLDQAAEASTTRGRSTEAFEDLVTRMKEDGDIESVFVPVDEWNTYFQSKEIDPKSFADELVGNTTEYATALSAGTDIAIPLEKYASMIAGTEHHAALLDDLRFNPADMTLREAREWEETAPDVLKDYLEQTAQNNEESSTAVFEDVLGQLLASGVERSVAETQAKQVQSVFTTLGERSGIDSTELYQQYGLEIAREIPEALRPYLEADTSLDPIIDRLRADDRPTQGDIFGTSLIDFIRESGGFIEDSELSARDAELAPRLPGQINLVQEDGITLDHAAEIAQEAGYIQERDVEALLDALDTELRGDRVYVDSQVSQDLLSASQAMDAVEERMNDLGINLEMSNNEIKALIVGQVDPSNVSDDSVFSKFFKQVFGIGQQEEAQPEKIGEGDVSKVETGKPVTFDFIHNTESATTLFGIPDESSDFGRGFEPSGRFVRVTDNPDRIETEGTSIITGELTLQNPLVVDNDSLKWKRTLSEQYDGKTGSELSQALIADGYDGVITTEDNYISEIVEFTTFEPSKALYQSATGETLFVAHNLSAENLVAADELGGLPAPSLAIKDIDKGVFDAFGEITLLARPEITDSSRARTFDADIYTPRAPRALNQVNRKKFNTLIESLESEKFKFLRMPGMDEIESRGVDELIRNEAVQYQFLTEKGVNIPAYKDDIDPLVKKAAKLSDNVSPDILVQIDGIREAAEEYYIGRNKDRPEILRDIYYDENEQLDERFYTEFAYKVISFNRSSGLDKARISSAIYKKINSKKYLTDFENHVADMLNDLVDKKVLFKGFTPAGNRKYAEYNMQNVVREMTRELQGGENFNYGAGSVRAVFANEMKTVRAIKARQDQLRTKEEIDTIKEESSDKLMEALDSLKPHYKFESNSFGYYDDASSAIAEGRRGLEETFNMDEDDYATVDELIDYLRELPTEYFEVKIQRPVEISEFDTAIVPRGTNQRAVDILDEAGLTVRYYKKGDTESRQKAIKGADSAIFFQKQDDDKRGQIQFTDKDDSGKRKFRITLLEKADLSTFLHETGHLYLEVLADLAERDDAPQQIQDDFQATMDWMGVNSRDKIGTDQHEQWARGYEAYLREGKAPSPEMQTAFSRFRAWLIRVYKELKSLNVQLSDEVRAVFDRLVATDEEIQAAEQQQGYEEMFTETDAEIVGMSDQELADYGDAVEAARIEADEDITKQAMAEISRENQKWWKDARIEMRAEVAAEVEALPVYQTLSFLQKGTLPDGTEIEGVEPVKLDKTALVNMYGKEFLKRLPRPYIYTREGGAHPDIIANMFAYQSGDEMIKALINARKMNDVIEAETDMRMRQVYGDMRIDGTVPDKAMNAVHNEKRVDVMMRELRILNRNAVSRGTITTKQIVKAAAIRIIGDKKVKDINLNTYRVAEAKASNDAFEMLAAKDFDGAAEAKRKQILNHELYRQAVIAKEKSRKNRDRVSGFGKKSAQERLGKAGADYQDQMNQILNDYEFRNVTLKRIQSRESLREFLNRHEADVQPIDRPAYATDVTQDAETKVDSRNSSLEALRQEAEAVNWRSLTVNELQGVRDNADLIWHLAKLKDELLRNAEFKRIQDAAESGRDSINDNANRKVTQAIQAEIPWNRVKSGISEYLAKSRRIPQLVREMDGGNDNGVMFRLYIQPLNEATGEHTRMIQEHSESIANIYDESYTRKEQARMLKDARKYESIGISLTKDAVLSVAMNWGNVVNRDRIMKGEGWSQEQVQSLLATLDERDWTFVQSVWDYLETYKKPFFDNHKELFGIAPVEVEADPFTITSRDGVKLEMRGGYYPVKFDNTRSVVKSQRQLGAEGQVRTSPTSRSKAGAAHTRVNGNVSIPIRLSVLSVVNEHVSETIHHIAFDIPLLDVAKVLTHKELTGAIIDNYGRPVYDRLNRLLVDLKFGVEPAKGAFERFVDYTRNGASIAGMAMSVTTALLQPLGISNSVVSLRNSDESVLTGYHWMLKGVGRMGKTPMEMQKAGAWVTTNSEFMRFRRLNPSREIGDVMNRIRSKGWRTQLDAAGFWLTANLQFWAVDVPTWYGAYEKAKAAGENHETAVILADQTVRDAQGGGELIDQTEYQRDGVFARLFTNFMSYMATTWSILATRTRTTSFNNPAEVFNYAHDMIMLMVVPAVGSVLLDMIASAARGDDEDDDDIATRVAMETSLMFMGPFVGIREFGGVVRGFDSYEGPAGITVFGDTASFITQAKQMEADEAFYRSTVRVGGVLFHLPAVQIDRTTRGAAALYNGETDNPGALMFGPPRED